MKTSLFGLVLVSAASVLVGCSAGSTSSDDASGSSASNESPDSAPLSCSGGTDPLGNPTDACTSYSAMPNDERSQWCSAPGEKVVDQCPTENVFATCTFTNRLGTNVWHWYNDDQTDPALMRQSCSDFQGTFAVN